ncbi:hypothetical protein LUZ60_014232 [Juncus effusus]|nr:hypothetical protein LUZ60_014232 [Juncus effusus]
MSEDMSEKLTAFGQRLKITGSEVGKKMTAGMSSMSFKMKEFFQGGPNQADQIVESATSPQSDGPDWSLNLEICDLMNTNKINSLEIIRAVKKRISIKDQPMAQYLALVLLETIVKNCDKAFAELAAERVVDEMVRIIDDPGTVVGNRNKALVLIEAWGESGEELRYLPVYEETYKSLKSRGIRFPGRDEESLAPIFTPPRSVPESESYIPTNQEAPPVRAYGPDEIKEAIDVARNSIEILSTVLSSSPQKEALEDDLTSTLVQQCNQSQYTIQKIIESSGENETFLFEALSVNDELQKILDKYQELKNPVRSEQTGPEPAVIPVSVEPSGSANKPAGSGNKPVGEGNKPGGVNREDDSDDDLIEF